MRSIPNLIKENVSILFVYAIITFIVMCCSFTAGKEIGYDEGVNSTANVEYNNGITDGLRLCIDSIFHGSKKTNVSPRYIEEAKL